MVWLLVEAMDAEPNASASDLGARLYQNHGRKAGQSAEAIAQHIRRLRKERKKERRFPNWLLPKTFLGSI
jgi:hypothetical protein